jgi:hypothetical protein
MKIMKIKSLFFRKRTILLISSLVFTFISVVIIYSCSKSDFSNNTTEELSSIPKPLSNEKQFFVTDKSGNNSITIRVSSDDESLLADRTSDNYELIINPDVPEETKMEEVSLDDEDISLIDFNKIVEVKRITVQTDIISVNFKDDVKNYALVSHGSIKIDEEEMEEDELKAGLCFWYPRGEDYDYYDYTAWGATSVKMTFNRTALTCNNIIYYVCQYNNPNNAYAYHHLKHPGDEATTTVQAGQPGITLLYKHYKNQIPTYTFYY